MTIGAGSIGRAGTSLVEMLLVIALGGLITAAAVTAIAPTNQLAREATEATQLDDGARSTAHFLAGDLRRVAAGGVLVATADSVVVAMPVALGAVCANDGLNITVYLGLGGATLDPAAIDGYAIRSAIGVWTYVTYSGTMLFAGAIAGRTPCTATGGGAAGSDTDYFTLATGILFPVGTSMLVWDRQTYRFGTSLLDPTTRGFHHATTETNSVEVAYALHPDSRFEYRLQGSTTWSSSVLSTSVGSIDAVRVLVGSIDGLATDMKRDIPLMNTE